MCGVSPRLLQPRSAWLVLGLIARPLGVGNGLVDPLGVLVSVLAAAAGLPGLLGDVAVLAQQDGDGVAEPGEHG